MQLEQLFGAEKKATLSRPAEELRELLEDFHPEDLARALHDLSIDEVATVIRAVDEDLGVDILERLNADVQASLLGVLRPERSLSLVVGMAPDDRVDLVQELPKDQRAKLMVKLRKEFPEIAKEVRDLDIYGEDTAGGLMTPEFVSLSPETKVWEAVHEVRRLSEQEEAETIYYIYVLYDEVLVGVVSLRQLLLGDPSKSLEDIMERKVVRVSPADDQEQVADMIAKYDLSALPVVTEQGVMLGVVTVDDVFDVIIEEATEDAQKMGGILPLEDSYFQTDFATFVRKRVTWLLVLFGGQLLTATVMESYEAARIAGLVVFIPLIIATGGNSGAQSSTLIIRALAVGEMKPNDWFRVGYRELGMGLALGLLLGGFGFARALFVGENASVELAWTVFASITAVVTLGTMMGSLLPLAIQRIGFDPAVSSTPFIASLVDVLGLVLYFVIAASVFGIAL